MKNIVPAAKPIIAMYGDSTTAGWTDSGGITSNNEPALLQAALPGVIVENHGISGITCDDLLNGRRSVQQNWWMEMSTSKAAIVTVNLGLNDVFRPENQSFYKASMGVLVRVAQGYGKIVVIETPNPLGPNFTQEWRDRVQSYAADARDAARANDAFIIDQWTYDQELADWQSHLSATGHPDDTLYAYKARVALSVLGPLVRTLSA
jgi:lysophospholipase L1-like esterase